jgi:hypothetical protein
MKTLQDRAVSCRYCDKTLAYGTSRQQQHLEQCQKYQASLQETRKRKRNDSTTPITAFDQINPHEQNELDELAALMIYDIGLPLGFFEYPAVQSFFHRLRPAYNLPSRTRVSTTLLDDSYQAVKQEVEEYIDKQDNLCLSFDESNDVANNRIMNISVTTERGAFFVENIDLGAATVTAEYCTQLIEQRAQVITKGRLGHINSISTDTGGAMPKTARLLKALPSFQHTFMIPCDPHGLQLLIQDICNHPPFQKTVKQADEIVAHFKSSKKQYQILKSLQRELCPSKQGKALALILHCKVRWGTCSGEFQRLLSQVKALRAFTTDPRIEDAIKDEGRLQSVVQTIQSRLFWLHLAELEEIVTPIAEAQLFAQTDHAHIGFVKARWDKIWLHLKQCEQRSLSLFTAAFWEQLEARKKRQLTDLHTLAYWLLPQNVIDSRFQPG